jgi:hypothetical protein
MYMNHTPDIEKSSGLGDSAADSPARGADDRRSNVNPAQNPAPSSPDRDEEATRRGEDVLERVKPY